MNKKGNSELGHITNVVESIEAKVDQQAEQIAVLEGKLNNLTTKLDTKLDDVGNLVVSSTSKNFHYLKELKTVTLFEIQNFLKNQILESSENVESGLAALISNLENVINTNVSVYSETEIKLLKKIIALLNKSKD
nr:hypothetical protein [Ulva laetevirens]